MIESLRTLGRSGLRAYFRLPVRGKSRLLSAFGRFLAPKNDVEDVRIGPCKVPLSHSCEATRNMAYGTYENEEIAAVRTLIRPGASVVDIGANVGFFSAHLAAMVGPTGKVISVEPGPTPLSFLKRTAESSTASNIQVIQCAVGGRTGKASFFETEVILAKGYGRIDERPSDKFQDVREFTVDVVTPVELLERAGVSCVAFIKIDVEGQEKNVVLGLEPLFSRGCYPVLMTEVTIEPRWKADLEEYLGFLTRHGYQMCEASPGLRRIEIKSLKEGFHGNVIWLHESSQQP